MSIWNRLEIDNLLMAFILNWQREMTKSSLKHGLMKSNVYLTKFV